MTKIVINCCYGGYSFSQEAQQWLAERGLLVPFTEYMLPWGYDEKHDVFSQDHYVTADWRGIGGEEPAVYHGFRPAQAIEGYCGGWERQIPRHHPLLVACVEALGEAANGRCANLQVVTIEGSKYIVDEYDGFESVLTPEEMKWIDAGE